MEIVFAGLDRGVRGGHVHTYERSLSADEVARPDILLAYEMNGESLPPQHGATVRLMVPGWYGWEYSAHGPVLDLPGSQQQHGAAR